jgi:hypothetical protein
MRNLGLSGLDFSERLSVGQTPTAIAPGIAKGLSRQLIDRQAKRREIEAIKGHVK